MSKNPIGIFDSGIGGLTIAHAIKKKLPNESLIYFGDTKHLPYGEKSEQAIKDSNWVPRTEHDNLRTGVMIGSGIGGLSSIADTAITLKERGPRRVSPCRGQEELLPRADGPSCRGRGCQWRLPRYA